MTTIRTIPKIMLGMPDVIFGAVLIVVLILLPNGIGGALRRLFGPLTTRLYSKS